MMGDKKMNEIDQLMQEGYAIVDRRALAEEEQKLRALSSQMLNSPITFNPGLGLSSQVDDLYTRARLYGHDL